MLPEKSVFFLTACEPSGDRLGAAIIKALREKQPGARFVGVAGPLMRAAGCKTILAQESLAVMGIVEVLKQLPHLLKARQQVIKKALSTKPTAYIGIDAPDFNLYVETKLKAQGVKTIHVNSPTVWAWRPGRIQKIKRAVDLMLVLFPFEKKIYEEHQISVEYIGHPLADEIPLESQKNVARQALDISATDKVLALMPGSRSGEIKHLAPVFLEAANICRKTFPELKVLAPMINEARARQFGHFIKGKGNNSIEISIGNAHQVLQAADAVLIASGTATLEAMLCKTPMAVAYKADALSFWIAKRLVKIPHVSLPNILAGKEIVPELLQEEATAENLAAACVTALSSDAVAAEFYSLHQMLKQHAAEKAAEEITTLVKT